jgi:hypothetical protein
MSVAGLTLCCVLQNGVVVTVELKAPMTGELVWANVMRPRIPLVYLDLNTIIYIARALRGDTMVPEGYVDLYAAALLAKSEQRAMFPLSGAHLWEISKITDPRQRGDLADILEALSDYNYLLGRTVIAELEFEAGMAKIMVEDISAKSVPLVRPTFGQTFGWVGGMRIRDSAGGDGSDAVRAQMTDADFDKLMARMNYEMERGMLRGPSDEDLKVLRAGPNFRLRWRSKASGKGSNGNWTPNACLRSTRNGAVAGSGMSSAVARSCTNGWTCSTGCGSTEERRECLISTHRMTKCARSWDRCPTPR